MKTEQRELLPDFEIIRDMQVPRDHYPRSTKSRIKKEAQNLPEEDNSHTLLAGKLCLQPNADLVTLS